MPDIILLSDRGSEVQMRKEGTSRRRISRTLHVFGGLFPSTCASARLHMLIFYLSCLFSPNMEGLGHFRLSDNSMGNQETIRDIKMDLIDEQHRCMG